MQWNGQPESEDPRRLDPRALCAGEATCREGAIQQPHEKPDEKVYSNQKDSACRGSHNKPVLLGIQPGHHRPLYGFTGSRHGSALERPSPGRPIVRIEATIREMLDAKALEERVAEDAFGLGTAIQVPDPLIEGLVIHHAGRQR